MSRSIPEIIACFWDVKQPNNKHSHPQPLAEDRMIREGMVVKHSLTFSLIVAELCQCHLDIRKAKYQYGMHLRLFYNGLTPTFALFPNTNSNINNNSNKLSALVSTRFSVVSSTSCSLKETTKQASNQQIDQPTNQPTNQNHDICPHKQHAYTASGCACRRNPLDGDTGDTRSLDKWTRICSRSSWHSISRPS